MIRLLPAVCLILTGLPAAVRAEAPTVVSVAHPIVRESADYDFAAQVEPLPRQALRAPLDGVIEKVHCQVGQSVKQGELLFTLESKELQKELRNRRSDVLSAEEKLQVAERALQNARQPLDIPSLTARRDLAAVTLDVAKKQVASIEQNLQATSIVAPINGNITDLKVEAGSRVTASTQFATLLGTLMQTDPVFVSFQVDERTLLFLRKLAAAEGESKESHTACPVSLHLIGGEGFDHQGSANCADNRLDPKTGRIRFLAEFSQPTKELLAAANERDSTKREAMIRLTMGQAQKQVIVPVAAIGYDKDGQPFVLIVDAKHTVHAKPVKLGVTMLTYQTLSEGPGAEDWVIVGAERATTETGGTLSPDDFTTDIRSLRIKPGAKVAPVRVDLALPQNLKTNRARPATAPK